MERSSVGEIIREARVSQGLKLRELAKRMDIAPSYLSDIENERRVPSEELIRKIASHLSLDFDDLMARTGKLGGRTDRYLRRTPEAGVLFRKLSESNFPPDEVKKLIVEVDRLRKSEKE
jgi:transcriptional regulator with XRE-family HTH domain